MKMAEDWEKRIKTALQEESADMVITDTIKKRIDAEIYQRKEEKNMKHFGMKRVVIGVAAACLLLSGGVYASKTAGFRSSMSALGFAQYASFEKLEKAEQELGYEVDCVEAFSNGYHYAGGNIHEVDAIDEDGNTTYTTKQLTLEYEKEGEPGIALYIEKPVEIIADEKQADAVRWCGDVKAEYKLYTYKFVPGDYELTPEDEENQARDDYYISYGSSEVEIQLDHTVTWEKEGISYHLMGFDLNLTPEEMLTMAEEIIQAK